MRKSIGHPETVPASPPIEVSDAALEALDDLLRPLGVQFVKYETGEITAENLWPQEHP